MLLVFPELLTSVDKKRFHISNRMLQSLDYEDGRREDKKEDGIQWPVVNPYYLEELSWCFLFRYIYKFCSGI